MPEEVNEELAAALDEALTALQTGRPLDRSRLLVRFPQLAEALSALEQMGETVRRPEAASPDNQPSAPERIGPYVIERELGAGGFGVVYQAYDPDVKRRVAVKLLHRLRLDQPEAVERFQREACVTARLRHPGIVQLYDYSRQGPPYYLVTELVEGMEPCSWCRHQQATPEQVADLMARMAEAVEHAHAQGVCHRDLKPANVLIDPEGNPHILDFGLARLDWPVEDLANVTTSDGRILGSLAYMAPEQAAGRSHDADARSDVYSLGVILYELLTGRQPFQGPAHALPARVVDENPPPPRHFNSQVSRDLEAICLKALAKRPDDRYRSAAALARDLRAFIRREPIEARRLTWVARLHRILERRHHDTRFQGWTPLLLLEAVTILVGCTLANGWEILLPSENRWWAVLLTKSVQVALMLFLAYRFRPVKEPAMTAAERQIWALIPAYYGGYLTVMIVNLFLKEPIPVAPVLAVLSGMGFMTLGATIWGWFYVWGAAFFGLAVLIAFCAPFGMAVLGLGWFLCLVIGSAQLRWTR